MFAQKYTYHICGSWRGSYPVCQSVLAFPLANQLPTLVPFAVDAGLENAVQSTLPEWHRSVLQQSQVFGLGEMGQSGLRVYCSKPLVSTGILVVITLSSPFTKFSEVVASQHSARLKPSLWHNRDGHLVCKSFFTTLEYHSHGCTAMHGCHVRIACWPCPNRLRSFRPSAACSVAHVYGLQQPCVRQSHPGQLTNGNGKAIDCTTGNEPYLHGVLDPQGRCTQWLHPKGARLRRQCPSSDLSQVR
eukprot:SAG31_NODE_1573_length_7850_cov_1.757193_1_plen_245_part_00